MKKVLILFLGLMLIAPAAFADDKAGGAVEKGTITIGGSSSTGLTASNTKYSYDNADITVNQTGFKIDARGGYFVIDSLVVGGKVLFDYCKQSTKNGDTVDVTTQSIGLGGYAGYYFDLGSAIYPFAEGGLVLGTSTTDYDGDDTKETYFGIDMRGGAAFFIAENVALDASMSLGYTIGTASNHEDADIGKLDFGILGGIAVFF